LRSISAGPFRHKDISGGSMDGFVTVSDMRHR
jgi:hypothetical protein